MRKIELAPGDRLNKRLVYLSEGTPKSNQRSVLCRCECGTVCEINLSKIRCGHTQSCGCYRDLRRVEANTNHGHAKKNRKTPEYIVWESMISRCYNQNLKSYKDYGGRGVSVCDEWREDFTVFYRDMGEKPSRLHTIERVDVNGDYCKENCKWASRKEQASNTRRNLKPIEYNNASLTLNEWSEALGINYMVLYKRIYLRGWSIEKAFTTPPMRGSLQHS